MRQGLTVSPRLECSDTILAHCRVFLLGSRDPPTSACQVTGITGTCHHLWLIFTFFVQTEFHQVAQAGLKLLSSSDPPASASQSVGITAAYLPTSQRAQFSIQRNLASERLRSPAGLWKNQI
uniref:Uncharacterized protein n=1 Tax=Macaca mulatta TaxID=9544 RepID=A0A5F8AVG5_MACMU